MAMACNASFLQTYNKIQQTPVRSRRNLWVRAANGGCCGGSTGGNTCSSHSKKPELTLPDLEYKPAFSSSSSSSKSGIENVGKEFEALVAQQTLMEIEKTYETTQMKGTISKEVVQEAMHANGEETNVRDNSCVDIDELLAEAADCNFIFADDPQEEEIVLV